MIHNLTKKLARPFIYILIVSIHFLHIVLGAASIYAYELDLDNKLITDQAGILSDAQEENLESMLLDIEREHKAQIAIVTLESLQGEEAVTVAYDIAESNAIGKDGIDSGGLILIAPNERKRRIETGYGLEGPIPDVMANRIGTNVLVPAFRVGDYAGGLTKSLTIMGELLDGEFEGFVEEDIGSNTSQKEQLYNMMVVGGFLMYMIGLILRGASKLANRSKLISQISLIFTVIAMFIAGWLGIVLVIPYILAGIFGLFSPQSSHGGVPRGGFARMRGGGSSFGGGGFGGFGGGSFGGGGAGGGW